MPTLSIRSNLLAEYSLTELGKSLMLILDLLCVWGSEHMGDGIEYKCEK